jgi:hypothetical protein
MSEREPGKSAARPQAATAKTTPTKAASAGSVAGAARKAAPKTAVRKTRPGAPPSCDLQALIQQRAYELWERDGRPEGREHAHWAEAEQEIVGTQRAA